MLIKKPVFVTALAVAGSVAVLSGVATRALAGTASTTGLDRFVTATVEGQKALPAAIVAGRIQSKYHPLPWIGRTVSGVSCPTGLKAVAGTRLTCTARSGGRAISVPVTVTRATDRSVTWTFKR